jgi:hypothetical protein
MHLIRVGRRRINLEYLIMDEANDGTPETAHIPPGGIRVTLEAGKEFDLTGDDAASYNRQVEGVVCPDATAKPSERSPVVGHAVRRGGAAQPRIPEQRKRGG